LRVACLSERKARTQALNQMRSLISTAPDDLRADLRDVNVYRLLERVAACRPGTHRDPRSLTKLALRLLARRALSLKAEIIELDAILKPLVMETAPESVARVDIGTECASALLVAAGDNPERLRHEATFAHLCGVAPIDASNGKHEWHRLNRGGDRQANSALWKIVITRKSPRRGSTLDPRWSPAPVLTAGSAARIVRAVRAARRSASAEGWIDHPRGEVLRCSPAPDDPPTRDRSQRSFRESPKAEARLRGQHSESSRLAAAKAVALGRSPRSRT
jgi:hypothetical protein